jgi:hypothetical protein
MSRHNAALSLPLGDRDETALLERGALEPSPAAGRKPEAPDAPENAIAGFTDDVRRLGVILDEGQQALEELRAAASRDWPTTLSAARRLSEALGMQNVSSLAIRLGGKISRARRAALQEDVT